MRKLTSILLLLAVMSFVGIGCESDRELVVTSPENAPLSSAMSGFTSVDDIISATLNVYVNQASGHTVSLHRVTQDWDEMTVTYSSFGGNYDAAVVGTFMSDDTAWKTIDVTDLVKSWIDGSNGNFGILLEQEDQTSPRTELNSREAAANNPYIELCYVVDGGTNCELLVAVGDAYIYELYPDANTGDKPELNIGWYSETDLEKQALIKFEFPEPEPPQEGCSRTIGYWKTHAGFGPQADVVTPLLPIWLGTADGDASINVTTATMARNILVMKTYGKSSNGITKLYAQMLGAKLNTASGASGTDISDAFSEADAFLADHDWTDWDNLDKDTQKRVLLWQATFDMYNNGDIGPGHCD